MAIKPVIFDRRFQPNHDFSNNTLFLNNNIKIPILFYYAVYEIDN